MVELANVETWTILLTGGRLKAESLALVGSQCEKYLEQLPCRQGLRLLQGARPQCRRDRLERAHCPQAKQAMLRAGRQKILVVDSSKFDKVSFVNITPVSERGGHCDQRTAPARPGCATSTTTASAACIRRSKRKPIDKAAAFDSTVNRKRYATGKREAPLDYLKEVTAGLRLRAVASFYYEPG